MDAYGRPESWRELWREATPAERRGLVFLLARLALIITLALAVCAAGVWVAAWIVTAGIGGLTPG